MRYSHIRAYTDGGVVLHYSMIVSCSKCGKNLGGERDVKRVNFCPSCGKELRRLPMNFSPFKIVELLNKEVGADEN